MCCFTSRASGVMNRSQCLLRQSPSKHFSARATTFSSKDVLFPTPTVHLTDPCPAPLRITALLLVRKALAIYCEGSPTREFVRGSSDTAGVAGRGKGLSAADSRYFDDEADTASIVLARSSSLEDVPDLSPRAGLIPCWPRPRLLPLGRVVIRRLL